MWYCANQSEKVIADSSVRLVISIIGHSSSSLTGLNLVFVSELSLHVHDVLACERVLAALASLTMIEV
jgi:hypothetical protein